MALKRGVGESEATAMRAGPVEPEGDESFSEAAARICEIPARSKVRPTAIIEAGRQLCAESWASDGPWRLDVLLLAAWNAQMTKAPSPEVAYHTAGMVFDLEPADACPEVLELFRWWRERWAGWESGDESPMQLSAWWFNARSLSPPWILPHPWQGERVGVGCSWAPVFGYYKHRVEASGGAEPELTDLDFINPGVTVPESGGIAEMVRAHRDLMISGEFVGDGASERFLARAASAAEMIAAEDWSGPAGIGYLYVLLGAAADVMSMFYDDERSCAPAPLFVRRPTSAHERVLASFDYWANKFGSWVPGHISPLTELRAWFAGEYLWSTEKMELSGRYVLQGAPGPFGPLDRQRALWSGLWHLAEVSPPG